jgi:hypothetical protein
MHGPINVKIHLEASEYIERKVKYTGLKKNVYKILLGVLKKRDCFGGLGVDKRMTLKLS